ncbi:uncharacterized protein [Eulemur rufifrons]|uniref:uncharacterized protein isoform X2 n=1 Tax=Eulemur rufifrons TaxID=859984 RepID=UPI003743F4F5
MSKMGDRSLSNPGQDAKRSLFVCCGRAVTLDLVFWPALRFLPSWIWVATLPSAGRSNETAKKHKMNRQSNQPKTGGSSRPARRHLLFPSLEAL